MIQALRMADIVKKYNTPKPNPKVYKESVRLLCKKGKFQQITLPIKKQFKLQSDELKLYLSEFKITDGKEECGPVKLVSVKTADKADIYYTYWNRLHFFKLPKGMSLVSSKDPF